MSILDKQIALKKLNEKYECRLSPVKGKQIMFEGFTNGKKIVVCIPASKIHVNGHGWFDISTQQVEIFNRADIVEIVVRLEGNKLYFINYKELEKLLNLNMKSVADVHRIYVWEDFVEIRANRKRFPVQPEIVI